MTTEEPEYKRWEELLPVHRGGFNDPYEQLSARQLADLAMLARMVRLIETGKADAGGGMALDANRIRQAFARDGLDADWLLSQRQTVHQNRTRRSHHPGLDGRPVRLLGQMLLLSSLGGRAVSEFLLTETLGTCNHTPLLPFSQVAHVKAIEPVDADSLRLLPGYLIPWVWVEGAIRYAVSSHIAPWVGGQMRVEAAYSIDPAQVTPASEDDLVWRVEQDRQASEALLYPRLIDLVSPQ